MSGRGPRSGEALARFLIRRAARTAPPGLAARLEEEWLADLTARQSALGRVRFALGCSWAMRVIAREFGAAAAAAAGSASGQRLLVDSGGYDFSRLSRRTVAMIAIVCLHAAIFYLYLTTFGPRDAASMSTPLAAGFITAPQRTLRPTRLPPPTLTRTVIDNVPEPRIPLDLPTQSSAITVVHRSQPAAPPPPYPTPKPVNVVMGGPGAGFPNTEDYYPPAARRLGESGTAAVRVCVGPSGRLTSAPTILRSSGLALIDGGALRLARAGSGHYRPTTEDGRPVSGCYPFLISFRLRDF